MKLVDADEVIETLYTTDDVESVFLDLAQNRRLDYLHDVEESDVVDFARDVVNAVVGVIKTSPAVDAVEVARCKGCCKWEDFSANKGWEGKGFCRFFECTTLSDDFCSHGQRKEVSE